MKAICKILIIAVFFSTASGVYAYAEEMKTEEVQGVSAETVTVPSTASSQVAGTVPPVSAKVLEAAYKREVPTEDGIVVESVKKPTLDNLQTAFNGESNANAKYLAFAKKADEEGYGKVANLYRAAARAEQLHFERHAKLIKELGSEPKAVMETPVVKSTRENLQASIDGETYESTKMYPEFLIKAEADENEGAIDAFEDAGAAEAVHAKLYKQALNNLKAWKGKGKEFYVCPLCGNIEEQKNFSDCSICGTSVKAFLAVK